MLIKNIDAVWKYICQSEHFPKIHRSVLRKITIDLLYFWDVYDVNLWEKISAEVRLIHAERISYINFIALRKNNKHNWRLNKSSKTFQINGNLWVFLNWEVYLTFPKIYSNWNIIIILHVYTSSFKRRYANRKYSRCWQKYMTIEKICVVSIYWKLLATWPIQPRDSVKVFVLAMWYVCMRLLNIFPAVNTNSSRGEVLKFVNKGRF